MAELKGFHNIAGAFGTFHFNNIPVFEVKNVSAKVTVERADVPVEGGDVDSKMTMRKGEITFTVSYIADRGMKELLAAYNAGRDVRCTASIALNDPDAIRGQRERVNIANIWLNDIVMIAFARGEALEREYTGGFTPSDASYAETITV